MCNMDDYSDASKRLLDPLLLHNTTPHNLLCGMTRAFMLFASC